MRRALRRLWARVDDWWNGRIDVYFTEEQSPPTETLLATAITAESLRAMTRDFERHGRLNQSSIRMYHLLSKAAGTFRRYEKLHAAKGTAEGLQKAAANAAFAAEIETLLRWIDEGR